MTVKELIVRLQQEQQDMTVVTDLHSEYSEVVEVMKIIAFENGGYVSKARTHEQELKEHGYVYVGVNTGYDLEDVRAR